MKTSNLIKLTLAAVMLLAVTLISRAGILDSPDNPHNFSARTWNNDPADPNTVCGVCHVPHHANPNAGPLWGHDLITGGTWKMYANGVSPAANIKYSPALQPNPSSMACLSCHDGSVAVNAYGAPNGFARNGTAEFVTNSAAISERSQDLTHSHPISFNYDLIVGNTTGKDKWLWPSGNSVLAPDANSSTFTPGNDMTVKGFLLDQKGNLECNSCHDVHNQEGSAWDKSLNPHLVKINGTQGGVGSLLCRSCHNK